MDHIFLYALPTNNGKEARMMEIAAVRASGFGPYVKTDIIKAFTDTTKDNPTELLRKLKKEIVTDKPFVVVSHNNEITKGLLRIEFDKTGLDDIFAGRAWIDVNQLVWPLMANGVIKSRSLDALVKYFGITTGLVIDSADTCQAIVLCYGAIMRRYRTALAGEDFVREAVGGETLDSIRKIVGF